MISATLRRWRGLRPRWRSAIALLASVALLAGYWLAYRRSARPWPARVEFRSADKVQALAFSPDGRTFATSVVGEITLWDISSGRPRASWKVPEAEFAVAGAFSPDGRTFAAAILQHGPAKVALIDVASGRTRATGTSRHPQVIGVRYSADGLAIRLLSADRTGLREVVTCDPSTGEPVTSFTPDPPVAGSLVAASPDGRFLAYLPPRGGPISLRDTEADRPIPAPAGLASTGPVSGLDLSEDGRTLAIGRMDGSIDLWDIPSGRLARMLDAHGDGYASFSVRFSPDGRTIASRGGYVGSTSGLTRAWHDLSRNFYGPEANPTEVILLDLATGERVAASDTSIYPFYSADSRTIATRDLDGSVRLRDVPEPRQSGRNPESTPHTSLSDPAHTR